MIENAGQFEDDYIYIYLENNMCAILYLVRYIS